MAASAAPLQEKALSQGLDQPALLALSHTIEKNRKVYYRNLEANNKDLEITRLAHLFAENVLEAQAYAQSSLSF